LILNLILLFSLSQTIDNPSPKNIKKFPNYKTTPQIAHAMLIDAKQNRELQP
jgi:hypothetical protein